MYATERQQRIAGIVTDEGRASVTALSALFGVAQETIRRDLDQLQADGVLLRVHGGAVPAGRTSAADGPGDGCATQRRGPARWPVGERASSTI